MLEKVCALLFLLIDFCIADFGALGTTHDVKRLVMLGYGPNSLLQNGLTPLMVAINCDNQNTAKALISSPHTPLNSESTSGLTALHFAAMAGNAQFVDLLLSKKADAVKRDQYNNTALHKVCFCMWQVLLYPTIYMYSFSGCTKWESAVCAVACSCCSGDDGIPQQMG